jgi:hypothetical protein
MARILTNKILGLTDPDAVTMSPVTTEKRTS